MCSAAAFSTHLAGLVCRAVPLAPPYQADLCLHQCVPLSLTPPLLMRLQADSPRPLYCLSSLIDMFGASFSHTTMSQPLSHAPAGR